MASPFPRVKGVAIVVPLALNAAASEMTAFNYNREDARNGAFSIALAATSVGPATHHAGNYISTTAGFWWLVRSGSLIGNRPIPDWADADLLAQADAESAVYDPNGLCEGAPDSMPFGDTFDPTKITLIPLATGKWAEARDALSAELVRIEDE